MMANLKETWILWLARRLPPCEDICRTLSRRLDERIGMGERIKVKLHLWICEYCERFARQLELLQRLNQVEKDAQLSEDAKARIKNAIRSNGG